MKHNLAEDIIPVSEFKKNAATYLDQVKNKNRSMILTQNGHSAAVVISPQEFQKIQYERDLFASIAKGEKDIEEGKFVTHENLFEELYKKFK